MLGFVVKPETSTRYALHGHHALLQPALQTGHIERLLDGPDADRVLALVERLACGYLPNGWETEMRGRTLAAVPVDGGTAPRTDGRTAAGACLPPLDAPENDLFAHIARNVVETQVHGHTHRCKKGSFRGTDDSCAMAYPRPLHPATTYQDGVLRARLDVGSLVFYVPTVMLASPCNHTVIVGVEQSRWARAVELHRKRVALGEARPEALPVPTPLHEASIDASFYMCKYACKADNQDAHGAFLALATQPQRVRARHDKALAVDR